RRLSNLSLKAAFPASPIGFSSFVWLQFPQNVSRAAIIHSPARGAYRELGNPGYNHLAQALHGKGYSVDYWELMLNQGQLLWAFAVDDAHLGDAYPWPNGGWVWVKAEKLDADAITESLRTGRFYSSSGPQIHDVTIHSGVLRVKTSPCRTVCFSTTGGGGFCRRSDGSRPEDANGLFEEAEFDVSAYLSGENGGYLRVECEDEKGGRAWLNPIFF
ncbi:MAG: hypothetical protein QGH74_09170, partial [Candidatus Brocadiia bacterium]|nr:hypothetical protein [Candidatus Brocadiia bacterium]